ncbi:MAG: carbon-nitrogen hydrolase family protein, partial [Hyphomicrobiales bacterium]
MILRAGLVQLRSGRDMARNLADAAGLIRQAAGQGAALVATPEMTNVLEPDRPRLRGLAKVQAEDESVAGFSALAVELR